LNLIVENIKKEDSKSQEKKNPKIPPESKSSIEFSTTDKNKKEHNNKNKNTYSENRWL
jgi:hypothetical protein